MLWKPHKYQKISEKFIVERNAAALLLDPGLGKTAIALSALVELISAGKIGRVLVLAPLRVCYNVWPEEIKKWRNFKHLAIEIMHGRDPLEIPGLKADIFVANFDYLPKLLNAAGIGTLGTSPSKFKKTYGFDALIIDELSAFKHISSKRFKQFKSVVGTFDYRWGLTGSPVANRLIDIFGQIYVLDEGKTFGRYITHFRNEYFVPTGYGGYDWKPKSEKAKQAIFKKLKPVALRMAAEDYLDMPQLIVDDRKVELADKDQKSYNELHKDLVTLINDKEVVAVSKAAALNKCRQFVSGAVYYNSGLEFHGNLQKELIGEKHASVLKVHTKKYDALKELVEELQGEQLFIGIGFRFEAEILSKTFPKLRLIYGGTSAADSSSIIKEWNRGDLQLLAAHPASLAHGVNLQEGNARHICWLTLPWDNDQYEQFCRRLYRQGNKARKIFIHRLLCKNTVDGYIAAMLNRKKSGQNELFEALKKPI